MGHRFEDISFFRLAANLDIRGIKIHVYAKRQIQIENFSE